MDEAPSTIDTVATVPSRDAEVAAVAPGASIAGRYQAGREIARGGMGRVIEAHDTRLDRAVALKEVLDDDDETVARFARETAITARLDHRSIVPVYDAGRTATGAPFYVMRKVSGRQLEALVIAAGTRDERLALLPHLVAAAQAIAHAHRRGVIHRDIKPSNILVGELGETVVIDWGLAKVIDDGRDEVATPSPARGPEATRAGVMMGTPGFMPPEQIRGETVDARSDVYALGATLYYLLARRPPHVVHATSALARAAELAPVPVGDIIDGVPPELAAIAGTALEPEPAARYADAAAFADDLERFVAGRLVSSYRYSRRERASRFVRRHRAAVITAAIAVAGLAIAGVLAVQRVLAQADRTGEQAALAVDRQRAAEAARDSMAQRADQLLLAQARTLATENPTAAVALLKQLGSRSWPEARAIATLARDRGVARGAPGPRVPRLLRASPNGDRALVTGGDDTIRVVDLARGTSRIVATQRCQDALFAGDDLAMLDRGTLSILTGTSRRDVPIGTPIDLQATRDAVYWLDGTHRVWRLALPDGAPERLGEATAFRVSPDGARILYRGPRGVTLDDRVVAPEGALAMVWNAASTAFAVVYPDRILAGARWYPSSGAPIATVALSDNVVVLDRRAGLQTLEGGRLVPLSGALEFSDELAVAKGDRVITRRARHLAVHERGRERVVPMPVGGPLAIAASPASRYVVAAAPERILVWDLDARSQAIGDSPAWLGQLTNATTDAGAMALTWE